MKDVTKEELNNSIKTAKRPKFMKIQGQKVKIPKNIKRMQIQGEIGNVYADERIKGIAILKTELQAALKNNQFIVILAKSVKNRPFAFSVDLPTILQHRKARLANMINIEKVQEAERKAKRTKNRIKKAVDYIGELIPLDDGLTHEQIYDEFQSSMDDEQIIMDIKRLIQLQFQQQ